MATTPESLPKSLKIGSTLVLLAGLVPFIVASIFFVAFVVSVKNPSEPWKAGQFPPGPAAFTLDEVRAFNPALATDFVTASHIEFANVINSGFVIIVLSIFGLRRLQKFSWYTLLAIFLWAGLNDTIALIAAHEPPIPLLGEAIGLVGLCLSYRAIFNAGLSARAE